MTAPALWSVSGIDVVLAVLRGGVPGATFGTRRPDELTAALPYARVSRTGGASRWPQFWDRLFVFVEHWAGPDDAAGVDAARAAQVFTDDCRRALWQAWRSQMVTPHGWIARIAESEGPEEAPDPDLPLHGRFTATYELLVRRPQP